MFNLAIFTATRWECHAVRRAFQVERTNTVVNPKCIIGRSGQARICLFHTGVGAHKTAKVCEEALKGQKWDLVISTGYAAALIPSKIGAIIVADQVLEDSPGHVLGQPATPLLCDPNVTQKAFNMGLSIDNQTLLGRVVTVPGIVSRAGDKQEIARRTGAIALDMESATIARIADEKHIPFVVIRAISDLQNEDLPEAFNLFLRRFGWIRGLPLIIMSPKSWAHIMRLRAQMVQTSRQLTMFFHDFLGQEIFWNTQRGNKSVNG